MHTFKFPWDHFCHSDMRVRPLWISPDLAASEVHAATITATRAVCFDGREEHDDAFLAAKISQLAYSLCGTDVLACVLTVPVQSSEALILFPGPLLNGASLKWVPFSELSPAQLVLASTVAAHPGNFTRAADQVLLRQQMPGFPTPNVSLQNHGDVNNEK